MQQALAQFLLFGAIAYLIYKVHRIERRLDSQPRPHRKVEGNGKIVPILRNYLEPGPFRSGTGAREPSPPKRGK